MPKERNEFLEDHSPPEFCIASVNQQIRTLMAKTLRPHNLTLVEWRLLQCLQETTELTICELSTLAVIERTVTGRLVDKLVARNLVKKCTQEQDRRASLISLLPRGEQMLSACATDVAAARHGLFQGLTQDQINELLLLLKIVQHNAVAVCQNGPPAST